MKPRWVLLAVGLICLLVLAPASALSVAGWPVGCGTAVVDGVLDADEWEPAARLPMTYPGGGEGALTQGVPSGGEPSPAQAQDVVGAMLLMNDETHFYLGYEINVDDIVTDPADWLSGSEVCFADEPDALDDEFAGTFCPSHEGCYSAWRWVDGFDTGFAESFEPLIDDGCANDCPDVPIGPSVAWAVAPGQSATWEWAFDLDDSYIDKVGPGDCFLLEGYVRADVCEAGDGCEIGDLIWPGNAWDGCWPDVFGIVCLDPCEPPVVVEDFVPEPATMMLLGSGLMGLAGYAGLRLRKK